MSRPATMATTKTAPKPALTYDRKLVTAWKNVGEKAATKGYASLAKVMNQPGTWDALAAAFDAGKMPPASIWRLGEYVADHVPPRYALDVMTSIPEVYTSLFGTYGIAAVLLATALRADPHALDALRDHASETVRDLVEVARAEAGILPEGLSTRVRARLATEWAAGSSMMAALDVSGSEVTRVTHPDDARHAAVASTARRVFGASLAADLAEAHRARLAGHTVTAGQANAHALYPSDDALALAAPAMTPEEVCGFQMRYPALARISAAWSVDDIVRAAIATSERDRPGAYMLVNSLALLAIDRDPTAAPRVEALLNLADFSNTASPSPGSALATLLRAPAAWRRHFALDLVFVPDTWAGVYRGPIGLVMLASVDPEAAERVAEERSGDLDFWRISTADAALLASIAEGAGPRVRELLAAARA